jgi:hypothetical protein
MAAPENFIHAVGAAPPLAAGAPAPVAGGMIAPKMDAQIIAIVPPAVKFVAPVPSSGTPGPPPGAALATPAPLAAALDGVAGALTATVRGITPQNMPVLSVSFPALGAVQDFVMQFPADNMPPGAAVTVLPRPGAPAPHAAALLPAITPLPDLFAPGLWPALDEAFQALRHAAPQAAQVMAHSVLPNAAAPARLPAVAMMFVAAVQGGDLQNWLGERTIDTLRRIGKADVIGRLSRDGAALARMNAAEPGAQDWRSLPVPMLWDNHVHKIFLHYRHDRERGENGDDKKNGTRFVLDLRPARMGDVQLDGLHRAGTDKGRLDLIVRTRENISPPMQQAMRRLYTHALEQAALSGELSFQHRADGWVRVKTG